MAEYIVCISAVLDNLHDCVSFAEIKSTAEFLEYVKTDRSAAGGLQICFVDKDWRVRRKALLKPSDDGKTSLKEFYALLAACRPYGVFVSVLREGADCLPTSADDEAEEAIDRAAGLCGARFYDYCVIGADGDAYSYFVHDRTVFGGKVKRGEIYG